MTHVWRLGLLALVACHDGSPAVESKRAPIATADATAVVTATDATPVATIDATAPVDAAVAATPSAGAPPAGQDFIAEAKLLYRVAACADDSPLPDALTHGDAARAAELDKVVAAHCKNIVEQADKYRVAYFGKARAWFQQHEPKDLPKTVVYAFGGGDLVSALVAFPDATEITTLSLELAGDPRRLVDLSPAVLGKSLAKFRRDIGLLIGVGSNSSVNLSDQQREELPAQVSSHLLGLAVGGYELVAMRYFAIDDTGAIRYLEQADFAADTHDAKSLRGSWKSPNFAASFANVEIQFRKPGESIVRVHRHIAWDLADAYLKKHPNVLRHLEAKGKVTVLVKGASYLLWFNDFKMIRDYLLDHLVWMLSDSTGVPPNFAKPAGMVQEPFGAYEGPPEAVKKVEGYGEDLACRALWKTAKQPMPFRFGYLDKANHNHVMFTWPASP